MRLVSTTGLLPALVERGLAELTGAGIATAEAFAGLRALLARQDKRRDLVEAAGRWSLLEARGHDVESRREDPVEALWRRLPRAARARDEPSAVARPGARLSPPGSTRRDPWRTLRRGLRRRAVRGARRGGTAARRAQGAEKIDELVVLSAADPLNLVGTLTPGARVPAIHTNRILLTDGVPIAALEGGELRRLAATDLGDELLHTLLARRSLRHAMQQHLRTPTAREAKALTATGSFTSETGACPRPGPGRAPRRPRRTFRKAARSGPCPLSPGSGIRDGWPLP